MISILFFVLKIASHAQEPIPYENYISYYDSTWKQTNQDLLKSSSSNYSPFGEVFTPKGKLRILIIFAKFTNDADQPCGNWTAYAAAPGFVNPINSAAPDFIFDSVQDFTTYSNTSNRSISRFYKEMSKNQFTFIGDILSNPNGSPHCIEVDPTSNNSDFPYTATGWADINLRVMTKMKNEFPNFDWSPYDLRTNKPLYQQDNSLSNPDDKPDYVVIAYRYNSGWTTQPVASMNSWSGSSGGYSILNGLTDFTYNGYSFDGSGYTNCTGGYSVDSYVDIMLHEIAHELYSCPHIMAANSAPGRRWQFPASGWGMMTSGGRFAFIASHAWERWVLGWIELTAGASQVNTDIQSSDDLQNDGIYTLRDFVTTGDVVRIKIPNTNNNYLWLENHQLISVFDHKFVAGRSPSIDGEVIPEMSKGLYMYIENILGNRDAITTGLVYDMNKVNGIKLLNAQGNYDYWHSQTAPEETWDYYWNNTIFTFRREKENPISGLNPYFKIPDDYPSDPHVVGSDGVISYYPNYNGGKHETYPIIRETNNTHTIMTYSYLGGVNYHASNMLNRRSDAFQSGDEVSLSGIVPALNYPLYSKSNSKNGNYSLNGLNIKVLSYNSATKEMKVQIKFDDFTVRNDKRWCGFIDLPDNTGDSNPDLFLSDGVTLEIDKNGNANRHSKHPNFNDFVNPSIFTVKPAAKFMMEEASTVELKNYSSIVLDSGSFLVINKDATVVIGAGSTIKIKNGANLDISESGSLQIESGGYICIESGANITLQDNFSVINLRSGYNSGVNTSVFTDSGSCMANPENASFTGSGSINSQFSQDTYVQNEIISSDMYITGKNIYVGRAVTSSLPQGDVSIQNNSAVIFDAENEVVFESGFEIKLGSSFEVVKK